MKKLEFFFDTRLTFSSPVVCHNFLLRCLPDNTDVQTVEQSRLVLEPGLPVFYQKDGMGNLTAAGSCREPHTILNYRSEGVVTVDFSRRQPQTPHPMYRYPSPLAQPGAGMREFLSGLSLTGKPPLEQVLIIQQAVHRHLEYAPGTTNILTSAARSFALGKGVCQDYAQIMVTLCRMAGFSARYCVGLSVGEGASHAWAEVHFPEGWIGFDPTRGCPVDETYLRIAVGRDFSDCPVERGVFRGNASQSQTVFMSVSEL